MRERKRCACQAFIEADPDDAPDVAAAVSGHRRTAQHRDWWEAQQAADERVFLPVRVIPTSVRRVA